MFNKESFSSRKDQTIYKLNNLFDQLNDELYSKAFYSSDQTKKIVVGVQNDGTFGIVVYELDGDIETPINKTTEGITTLPNVDKVFTGGGGVKIEKKDDDEYEFSLQDTVRIETLKSCYPVGSVYINATDSRPPSEIMNWNDSKWEQKENSKIVKKVDEQTEPTYETIYVWERIA